MAAVGFIAASDTVAKLLSVEYATQTIVFVRALIGGAMLGVGLLLAPPAPRPGPVIAAPVLQSLRGLAAFAAVALFFWGVAQVPLANAVAVSASAPIFMALLAKLLLGEPFRATLVPCLALSVFGVGLIVGPERGTVEIWAYAAITLSALCYALVCVLTRSIAQRDSAGVTSLFTYAVMAAGAGIWCWAGGLDAIGAEDAAMFLLLGATGAAGMFTYSRAFDFAGVCNIAPWDNVVFLWALAFGVLVFSEIPGPLALLGGGLVVGAGALASASR